MDKTLLAKQIELYSNTIVAFIVFQGLTYSYNFGTNQDFNALVKEDIILSTGIVSLLATGMILGIFAINYLSKKIETFTDEEHRDLVKKIYMGKIITTVIFGILPITVTVVFAIL